MNWNTRYKIKKISHFSDISHPVPGSTEELISHLQDHHGTSSDIVDAIRGVVSMGVDPGALIRSHINGDLNDDGTITHPGGMTSGDHPHIHGEDTSIGSSIPSTVGEAIGGLVEASNWNTRYSITDPGRQQHSQGRHIINAIKENFGVDHELGSRMIDMIEANHRKDYPDCARCDDDQTGRIRSPYRQNAR